MSIQDKAMLVGLSISFWLNQARDRTVVEGLVKSSGAKEDVHRYRKILIDPSAFEQLNAAQAKLKATWRGPTLPWDNGGVRLLPAVRYQSFVEQIRADREDFQAAVKAFAKRYPKLHLEAKERLASLYREEDFPKNVASKFSVRLNFFPIPDREDFRVKLSETERDEIAENVEASVRESVASSMKALVGKMEDAVALLSQRMKEPDPIIRESLIANVKKAAEEADLFNAQLFGDKKISSLSAAVAKITAGSVVEDLREQPEERKKMASKADEVLAKMASYIGGAK